MALVWSPEVEVVEDTDLVARIADLTYLGRPPLHSDLVAMLNSLSRSILHDPKAKYVPQYVALAYWLRSAALERLCSELARSNFAGFLRVPRGVALHLPPTNVDTIFVYSWAMSVLAGNGNIVRLPESMSDETRWLVSTVCKVVADHGESSRHLFCTYKYGGSTDQNLANFVDLRMIWGGDAKVAAVSTVPIRPDGVSIGFPDRQSLAIIDSGAYHRASETERDALSVNFFNDVFWFNQMGCGSPRLLIWLGEPGSLSEDFFARIKRQINTKGYLVDTGIAISKLVLANSLLAEGVSQSYRRYDNALDLCRTSDPQGAISRVHGGGFLGEWVTDSLESISAIVTRKVQTLTYFGLSELSVLELAKSISGRGGYRVIPIGQALQFDPIWDGVDMFEFMTRKVLIR